VQCYDAHFTYGTNIGQADCGVPTLGIRWQPTVPPVVPELWRNSALAEAVDARRYTTIANWSAYGDVEWNGEKYGQKDREWLRLIELPSQTGATLELAVSGMPSQDVARFQAAGWRLIDSTQVSRSLNDYQSYVWHSAGEFSVAKHGYVRSCSGWISDRTVCYLAAGRPVVVQDTGVPAELIGGKGWSTFVDLPGAARALAATCSDYITARRDAMRLAEEVFSYAKVLPKLLDRI
jgi:hypothetical protein